MIYFDDKKQAYGHEIENYIAITTDELWAEVCNDDFAWTIENGQFVDLRKTQEYNQAKTKERKQEFKTQFFEIKSFGWYRKQPKGYGSAIESLNTAFNIVSITGILPADTLTFYAEPDFTKVEQCTEEWLVANSFKNQQMTSAEFGNFYATFVAVWNNEEHK